MKSLRIAELLQSPATDAEVVVKGWVRTKRGNKNVAFIALNDGEEVLGIGNVVNLPNGWFDSFIYLHLENTGTAYTLRVNDRTVAVVEDPRLRCGH